MSKLISVVTPCFNEEENVAELYKEVKDVFAGLPHYRYEHIFIDNASEDGTVAILKKIAATDKNLKIIVNARNFGHLRSPHYGLLQAKGDAVIGIVADLQEPPSLIPELIKKWEEGYKIVMAVKRASKEPAPVVFIRNMYYNVMCKLSEIPLVKNFSGFGLYDQQIVEILRGIEEPYPYFRGLICEIGFDKAIVEYTQPKRNKGRTKNNLYVLYDYLMLGLINHSKLPLRLATFTGFFLALISLMVAAIYFVYKLIYWRDFAVGIAPLVIGLFFFSSIQLVFIGIIGEYIGTIYTRVKNRPLVIVKERVNFDEKSPKK